MKDIKEWLAEVTEKELAEAALALARFFREGAIFIPLDKNGKVNINFTKLQAECLKENKPYVLISPGAARFIHAIENHVETVAQAALKPSRN